MDGSANRIRAAPRRVDAHQLRTVMHVTRADKNARWLRMTAAQSRPPRRTDEPTCATGSQPRVAATLTGPQR